MNKVALKKIGFADQNEIDDAWQQQQTESQQRSISMTTDGTVWHWFDSIDQGASSIEEELIDEESGNCYSANVNFVVRTESDMEMAKKYAGRPLVMKVLTVDGNTYELGTTQYPIRITINNRYNSMNTREIQGRCSYETLFGIMQ